MKNRLFLIKKGNLPLFLEKLREEGKVWIPSPEGLFYTPFEGEKVSWNPVRLAEPLKSLLFPSRFSLVGEEKEKKNFILGVKSCDLEALKIYDRILIEEKVEDPFYQERRENTLIISGDCTEAKEVCFCTKLGITPYPQEGFDLNLSPLEDNWLVEVGSEKGERVREKNSELFQPAGEEEKKIREKQRKEVEEKINRINSSFSFSLPLLPSLKESFSSSLWEEEAKRCVDCAGCNNICPTCYCFLLYERKSSPSRIRVWDGCLYTGFARVAGGLNPRQKLFSRFRHRLMHKFVYYPENYTQVACSGCGRCIEVCPGKIDMREVLEKVRKEKTSV